MNQIEEWYYTAPKVFRAFAIGIPLLLLLWWIIPRKHAETAAAEPVKHHTPASQSLDKTFGAAIEDDSTFQQPLTLDVPRHFDASTMNDTGNTMLRDLAKQGMFTFKTTSWGTRLETYVDVTDKARSTFGNNLDETPPDHYSLTTARRKLVMVTDASEPPQTEERLRDTTKVEFRWRWVPEPWLHGRLTGESRGESTGTAYMERDGDGWRVRELNISR
ncbi:MAG TPA: hypothetical protein VF980_09460 [Thermoanaerobaculia bacterium]